MANTKKNTSEIIWTKNTVWFPFIIFIVGTMVVGLAAYFMGGTISRPNGIMPAGTLPSMWFNILWPIFLLLLGLSTYFSWRSKRTRPRVEIKENLLTYYIHLLFIMFWPLVFYRIGSPIVAVILLGIAVLSAIYLFYRYLNSSIVAGIFSLLWALWLIYIFYFNLAYILIN